MFTIRHTKTTKQHRRPAVKQAEKYLWWLALGLLIYMPLHVFLAQSLSLLTGGLEAWKIAKDLIIFAGALTAGFILLPQLKKEPFGWLHKVVLVMAGYGLLHIIFLQFADLDSESAVLATIYNNRLSGLFLIGLVAGMYLRSFPKIQGKDPSRFKRKDLLVKTIYLIGAGVAVLAIVQYFLPGDFLENFGYSIERGVRGFFGIDSKPDLPRVFATLRDPNSLGALLIITLSLSTALFVIKRDRHSRLNSYSLVIIPLQLVALFLTFSRSAWLGAFVALGFIAWHIPKIRNLFKLKNIALAGMFLVFVGFALYPTIKESYFLENVIFHSDETTTELGSSEKHAVYALESAKEALSQPLGHGPGTAGIVSIRNKRSTVLPENYYVQIAYEVGVLGLGLFLALNYLVYKKLRSLPSSALRLALMASFWGLVITNMLLHTWSNEAVATLWWLTAGAAIGSAYYE